MIREDLPVSNSSGGLDHAVTRAPEAAGLSRRQVHRILTLMERAPGTLDIAMIHALSPRAKGRVERSFGTLQDRLIEEMRVADVCTLAEDNHSLEDQFIPSGTLA